MRRFLIYYFHTTEWKVFTLQRSDRSNIYCQFSRFCNFQLLRRTVECCYRYTAKSSTKLIYRLGGRPLKKYPIHPVIQFYSVLRALQSETKDAEVRYSCKAFGFMYDVCSWEQGIIWLVMALLITHVITR